jgi:hypothetical protein
MITEKQLEDLGFKKYEVRAHQSPTGIPFYYFELPLAYNLILISSGNTMFKDGYSVEIMNSGKICNDFDVLKEFIDIVDNKFKVYSLN